MTNLMKPHRHVLHLFSTFRFFELLHLVGGVKEESVPRLINKIQIEQSLEL